MTTEEANSGKKSTWSELEITGPICNLSPRLWQLHHLRRLYLNNNNLSRLPPDIAKLNNLECLDISSNKLRSLPSALGEMISLKELLLNNNCLRLLPYELGKLFQLQVLGLKGNPLPQDILSMYNEPKGTHRLLTFLLDNLNLNNTQPPQRPWIPLAHPESTQPIAIYTVMCYNVLCDKYATRQLYGYCPSWALSWDYRKKIILDEIRQYGADIISLQEVETEQFYQFFLPELKQDGYQGIFSPKSRARTMVESERKHVDGCAIFFRTSKFSLIKEHLVEFNQLAIHTAEGSADMINRVMTKDNIGLAALLETKDALWENGAPTDNLRRPILVSTCHVHWDPEFCDVKLIQTMMLMNELKNIIEETQTSLRPGSSSPDTNSIPLILCGDLNSLPESGVVEYLNSGHVDANHRDFKELGYEECLRKLSNDPNKDIFSHIFKLSQAYNKDVMPYTNYTHDFKGIIDYVFYSRDFMRPLGLLGPLDQEWFRENKVYGCPHPQIPSDHLPLLVEFEMGSNIGGAMQQPQQQHRAGASGAKPGSRR
ncbi:hypothetical protein CAPTEDRAFT_169418 [Capitella teleta]|uniref:poly(A)-specific ribonuclease n=1 Tax=Capitella teleta TaxID=283909 RepID=R7TRD0_CAPTE|nr:hypothetical protein CAPTEDRAFT_169418 [Capitella teleta]|eukprot:ELT96463.1 hypothetical protein CAPTEDRAFT_169418 [Capitella teleta]